MDTLLLNADYRPLDLLTWKDALSLMFRQNAYVLVEYEDRLVRSPSLTVRVPAVMVLKRFRRHLPGVRFSRPNIYSRDDYECQYCGASMRRGEVSLRDLTFDHVLPRSRGGKMSWTNIVTSCGPCNRSKGNRLPSEAGMVLRSTPTRPRHGNPIALYLTGRSYPEPWRPYVEPHVA